MTDSVINKTSDFIHYITINRAEVRNALNIETTLALTKAFKDASESSDIRCIVLSGKGTEAFCAGADLTELSQRKSLADRTRFFQGLAKLLTCMRDCQKPIISKAHGFVLAGGMGLIAASDIVLASDEAIFGLSEVKVGLAPAVVMAALGQVISKRDLAYLCLSAATIDAERAFEMSLVSQVIKKSKLDKATDQLALQMASFSPQALTLTRELLYKSSREFFLRQINSNAARNASFSLSPSCQEGIEKFLAAKNKKK